MRDVVLRAPRDVARVWLAPLQGISLATLEAVIGAGVDISAPWCGLRDPWMIERGDDAGSPLIEPMDVVMERRDGFDPDAALAFTALVREAAMQVATLPALAS